MTQSTTTPVLSPSGPLAPDALGHFTFRDGVWYLNPSPVTIRTPAPTR